MSWYRHFLVCFGLLVTLAGCSDSGTTTQSTSAPKKKLSEEERIAAAINELPEGERDLAKAQKFCAVAETGRLGSMGKPFKLEIDGKPVYLCCEGCKDEALKNPEETLAKVEKLKADNAQ